MIDSARKEEPKDPMVFINPEIIGRGEEMSVYEEGCLSIPEYYEEVHATATVKVRYLDAPARSRRSTRTACSPPACSTRSTISTAASSSTTCRS